MRWKEGGKMGKRAEKKAHQQPRCKWQCTHELQWASYGFIWGDIWYKIMPGFIVKSSFHLRNKENSKFSMCAPYKCSFNCHGRAATNHAIFKIWNASSPQMHLIFLSHFFMQLILENSTFILTRRGAEAILFLTKSWNRQQQHDRKTTRAKSNQPSWMAPEVHLINYSRT